MEARVVPHPQHHALNPHLRRAISRREDEIRTQRNAAYLAGQEAGIAIANHDHRGRVRRAVDIALATGLVVGGAIGTVIALALVGWLK